MAATTSSALDHSFNRDNSKFVSLNFDGDSKSTEKLSKVGTDDHNYQQQQSNQPLPEYVKTFSQVLASIGYMNINEDIYHKLRAMYPIVDLSDLDSGLVTNADLNLANLYKCDVYHHGCYFTASNERAFRQHLSSEHPTQSLFCFYCTKAGHGDNCHNLADHSQFSQPEQLVEHIKSQHKDIKYQCNLCFYRAFSADHVFIHQATEHLVNFEQTLKRAILDIEDELSPIEREFVQQTTDSNDDDTEVEDNEDDECGTVSSNQSNQQLPFKELCKIIICEAIDNNDRDKLSTEYFHAHALGLEKRKLEKYSNSFLQCAYCPTELAISSTSPNGSGEDFWVHSVTAHPEFPILAYDLSLIKRSSNDISVDAKSRVKKHASDIDLDTIADLNRIDDDLAERIVTNFREQLANNSLDQSYEETLMKSAFDYYENLESILMNTQSTSTGIKRKLENDTTDGPAAGTTNEGNKRRRLFERFSISISESAFQKTKRMARILATAAVAIGVYHLTHFLPDSVQAYLN